MALRLRRGTDAERQLITPLEGELIYVTDTKSLYVGDGNTQGGVLIATSGEVSDTLAGLLDTNFVGLTDGDVIRYDQTTGAWVNSQSALDLEDLLDVLFVNEKFGDVLFYDGLNWKNIASTSLIDSAISAITLDELTGVVYNNTPKYGDVLSHDGLNWKNVDIRKFADLILSNSQTHTITIAGNDSTILVDPVTNTLRGTLEGDVYGSVYDGLGNLIIDEFSKAALVDVRDPTNTTTVLDNFTGDLKRGENGQLIIQGGDTPVFFGSVDGPVRGSIVGPDLNIILNHDTATFTGNLVGSVFADDSSVILDGITGTLHGDIDNTNTTTGILNANNISANFGELARDRTTTGASLNVFSNAHSAFPISAMNIINTGETAIANELGLYKTRGTPDVPAVVQAGDMLGGYSFAGFDGSSPQVAATIRSTVDSASAGNIAANICFYTRNGAIGTFAKHAELTASGTFAVDQISPLDEEAVSVDSILKLVPRSSAPATPTAGMIAVDDGTNWSTVASGESLVIFLNGGWVKLS